MLPALRIALQREAPLNRWQILTSPQFSEEYTEPAIILLLGQSLGEIKSVQQRMLIVSAEQSALEAIEYQSIRTFLHRHFVKLRETQPRFVGYLTFLSWCEEIAVFFPDMSKSKGKQSQKKVESFGSQLEKASDYLLPEDIYAHLYQELQLLAPSHSYASKQCLINVSNSHFKLKTHPEVKVKIESILSHYRAWMETQKLFDPALADLSSFQFTPTKSREGLNYTHIIWKGDEAIPLTLQPYLEKITDTLITCLPLPRPLSTEEACREIETALVVSVETQSLFFDGVLCSKFLEPIFIQEMLQLKMHFRLLYRVFSIDVNLMVKTLKVLRQSPEILLDFISFILDSEMIGATSLFIKTNFVTNHLSNELLEIFAMPVCAKKLLTDYHLVLVDLINTLDLAFPAQVDVLNVLLTSVNHQLSQMSYSNTVSFDPEFACRYGALFDCLAQKHDELDRSDACEAISHLISIFACMFIEKLVTQRQAMIFLYRKVMRIFEKRKVSRREDLEKIVALFQEMHRHILMKTKLPTTFSLNEDPNMVSGIHELWDALRDLYASVIFICSKITNFTHFYEMTIQVYISFKEQLKKFLLSSRPEECIQFANVYIDVWATFKAEFLVAQHKGLSIAEGFFECVLNFAAAYPVNKKWPSIARQQVLNHSLFLLTHWLKLLIKNKANMADERIVALWQKWRFLFQNNVKGLLTETDSLVIATRALLSSSIEEMHARPDLIDKIESALNPMSPPFYTQATLMGDALVFSCPRHSNLLSTSSPKV